jgi:PhnB protein
MSEDTNKVTHAELYFSESKIFIADPFPEMGFLPNTQSLYVYLSDVDNVCQTAKMNGFICKQEPTDMFWGDRMCQLVDPFGNIWNIATFKSQNKL